MAIRGWLMPGTRSWASASRNRCHMDSFHAVSVLTVTRCVAGTCGSADRLGIHGVAHEGETSFSRSHLAVRREKRSGLQPFQASAMIR